MTKDRDKILPVRLLHYSYQLAYPKSGILSWPCWTPVLVKVSYEFACSSACLFLWSQCKISEMCISFFWFFAWRSSHRIRNITEPDFWQVLMVQESPKSPQNSPKIMKCMRFWLNCIHSCILFLFEYESPNSVTFCKNHVWKSGSWCMVQNFLDLTECRIF